MRFFGYMATGMAGQMRRACAILAMAMAAACDGGSEVHVAAAHDYVRYEGIWRPQGGLVAVNWQGSAASLRFTGTSIKADIESAYGGDQYRAIVDGVPAVEPLELEPGRHRYMLAQGLAPGEIHSVALFKETFSASANQFRGFTVQGPDVSIYAAEWSPALRIAFFGDSNMDGTSLYSEKDSGDSGTWYAFPASVSRMLDAEMQLQARGGATLGGAGGNNVMSFIFSADGTTVDKSYRTGFQPDVIVVNAGANDIFAVDPEHRKDAVKHRFHAVIKALRDVYGAEPHIVLMNAYGWDVNEPAAYTSEVAAEAGDRVSVLHFPWLWEQWHGSQWDHSGQAHMLAKHIAALDERWSIRQQHDVVDSFDPAGDVTNGGFEHAAPFGGFGWRYKDDGVERVEAPDRAAEGRFFIRLEAGEQVHQPTDATGDLLPGATEGGESYIISAMVRGDSDEARAEIVTHFEGQQLYTHDDDPSTFQASQFALTTEWRRYSHRATAGDGIWTLFHYLRAVEGAVDFDDVAVTVMPKTDGL